METVRVAGPGVSRLGPVPLRDDLVLGEEVDDRPALRLDVGELRGLHAAEWQIGDGSRNADIDADHAGLGLELEFAGVVAVLRVDLGGRRIIKKKNSSDRRLKRRRIEEDLDRAEDLRLV